MIMHLHQLRYMYTYLYIIELINTCTVFSIMYIIFLLQILPDSVQTDARLQLHAYTDQYDTKRSHLQNIGRYAKYTQFKQVEPANKTITLSVTTDREGHFRQLIVAGRANKFTFGFDTNICNFHSKNTVVSWEFLN